MKVTMIRNPCTLLGCDLTEGQTGTVDDPIGRKLVAAGIAVEIAEPAPQVKAVPPSPAIAEAKPPAIGAEKPNKAAKFRPSKPPANKESKP